MSCDVGGRTHVLATVDAVLDGVRTSSIRPDAVPRPRTWLPVTVAPAPQKPLIRVEEFGRPRSPGGWSLPRANLPPHQLTVPVTPDRLTIDPRQPVDLALAGVAIEQRRYRALEMWLQDVQLLRPLAG